MRLRDGSKPKGERLVSMRHDGHPIEPSDRLKVAASGLPRAAISTTPFPRRRDSVVSGKVSDAVVDYFESRDVVKVPPRGRQTSVKRQ